jgi:hypothetical protein
MGVMVTDIMAILIATATITTVMMVLIETIVTGIVVNMVQGMDPVIGDETIGQGGRMIFSHII